MEIPKELIDQINDGKCVIFIGAGLSKEANLPTWPELLQQMIDWSEENGLDLTDRSELEGHIKDDDLLLVADSMRERMDKNEFQNFMKEIFRKPDSKPTDTHLILPKIPFTAALTSNYDTLLESAYTVDSKGKTPHVFTHLDNPELAAALHYSEFYILKVHGTIDRIDSIIFGESDYQEIMHTNSAYRNHLKTLFSFNTVLFIGFGFSDPDLLLLLDELKAIYKEYSKKHYALLNIQSISNIKQKHFEKNIGINIIPYTPSGPDHPEVKLFLTTLMEQVDKAKTSTGSITTENHTQFSELDIKSYTKAIGFKYKTLDLDTLTPSEKEDFRIVQLSKVFVEQVVREDPPPIELPKEVWSKIKDEWGVEKEDLPEGLTPDDIKRVREAYYSKNTVPVLDIITNEKNKYSVILGDPGSGKSTIAKYILLSILKIDFNGKLDKRFKGYLPLLIELRDFVSLCSKNKCITFLDYFQYLGEMHGYGFTKSGVHDYLKKKGKTVAIFDGLDEIFDPKEWENVNHMIAGFAINYPNVQIIVTSRIVGYRRKILEDAGFVHFTIQDFEKNQINSFIEKWYTITLCDKKEEIKPKIGRIIKSLEESASIRQLAGNPLLLTILAIIGKHQELPRERWKLFDHAASVLVEHWEVNRHLNDSKLDLEFIGEDDKKELLRRVAYKMQSGPKGLAGNFIHKKELKKEIEAYIEERFKLDPVNCNKIAVSIINQFRERNFILCLYGADFFGFIHRTFLEYFCASSIVEKFNDHEIDINNLKNDYYEKYWEDETWYEVLRLICGMKEKLAGELIQHIMDVYHPQWFGKRPPWNIVLAIKCLSEIRNPATIDETSKILLSRVLELFEMIRWTKDIEDFLIEQIVPATKLVGSNWPHRNIITEKFIRCYIYKNPYPWKEMNLNLIIAWADFITGLGSNSKEIYQAIEKKLTGSNYSRYLAILVLGKYQPKNKNIIKILINSARHDYFYLIRRASVQAIAQGWHDDPKTLPFLKDRAINDENDYVRRASVQAIAQGWHDDPKTLPFLKDRAINDENDYVRRASVQVIAQGWHDDPKTLTFLKDRVVNDEDNYIRCDIVEATAQDWHDDLETLLLLKDRAANDENDDIRRASVQAIAQGWHDDPKTLPFLKDRMVNDENDDIRRASVQAIAQGWHDDPETLPLLKDRAVNDEYYNVRHALVEAIVQDWHDDPETLPLLKDRVVNDENNDVRRAAVEAIAQGWHDDPDTLPLLKDRAVNDENDDVRRASVQAIAQGWHDDSKTLPLLKDRAVNDEDDDVRYASVQAIAQDWHDDPKTLPLLKDWAVNDENDDVRYASVQAIAQDWHDDPETLPLLKDRAVNDEDDDVRRASVQAIGQGWHGDPKTLPLLKDRAVNDEYYNIRRASVQAIAQGWLDDPKTLPLLKDRAVNDKNDKIRCASIEAIVHGWHDDPETLPLLRDRMINDENYNIRHTLVRAIAQNWHYDPKTLPFLKDRAVNDENDDIRRASIEAIAQDWHDNPETLPFLKDRAVNDENDDVRRAAVQAIAQNWHDDPETLPLLKDRAVNDEYYNVRRAAVKAMATGWHEDLK